MTLSEFQIKEIKSQIIAQINASFPEDKKDEAISKIEKMDSDEIVQFLEQNNLIKNESSEDSEEPKCIFCSIISGDVPSTKIAENPDGLAILEINPLSEGHTIIISKSHSEDTSKLTQELAEKVKEEIKHSLNPKDIILEENVLFGHSIINVIPIYGNVVEKTRKKATVKELQEIKEKILSQKNKESKKEKTLEKEEPDEVEIKIIPKRIP